MRLDHYLSQATGLSRKEAQKLIRAARINVNGKRIVKPAIHIDPALEITLDNAVIQLPGKLYIMLHKPAGYLSATEDAHQPIVMDLIDHPHVSTLHIVGRLDKDTTGLLLLSNDGDWSHRISAPRHQVDKVYLADLAEPLSAEAAQQLQQGVLLHGEKQAVKAVRLEILAKQQVRIGIREGKYHQIKRMFAAVGNHVNALHRESIGHLHLDPALEVGEWRELSVQEVEQAFVS